MKDITIISKEEKESLIANTSSAKNSINNILNYLYSNMDKKDMGISEINPEDFLRSIEDMHRCISYSYDILKN